MYSKAVNLVNNYSKHSIEYRISIYQNVGDDICNILRVTRMTITDLKTVLSTFNISSIKSYKSVFSPFELKFYYIFFPYLRSLFSIKWFMVIKIHFILGNECDLFVNGKISHLFILETKYFVRLFFKLIAT